MQKKYRHELKYYISHGDYALISNRLRNTLYRDENTDERGEYFIRSLYFDDTLDTALWDKIGGVDSRFKYRIRTYNFTDKDMRLEVKEKVGQFISKRSVPLTRAQAEDLIYGADPSFLLRVPTNAARELYAAFTIRPMRPKVIVDYVREAYTYPLEDVRVTFDKDLHTALFSTDIFDSALPTFKALDDCDMIMEVKFNRYLPSHVRALIQAEHPCRQAISKYCICRKFE